MAQVAYPDQGHSFSCIHKQDHHPGVEKGSSVKQSKPCEFSPIAFLDWFYFALKNRSCRSVLSIRSRPSCSATWRLSRPPVLLSETPPGSLFSPIASRCGIVHIKGLTVLCATLRFDYLSLHTTNITLYAIPLQTVRFVHDTLAKEGYRTVMLHGQRSQPEREEALRDFRSGKCQVRGFCLCYRPINILYVDILDKNNDA